MLPPRSGGNTCPKPNAGKSGATSRIHSRSKRAFAFTATHGLPLKTRKNRFFDEKTAVFGQLCSKTTFLTTKYAKLREIFCIFDCLFIFTGGNRENRDSSLPSVQKKINFRFSRISAPFVVKKHRISELLHRKTTTDYTDNTDTKSQHPFYLCNLWSTIRLRPYSKPFILMNIHFPQYFSFAAQKTSKKPICGDFSAIIPQF
jgi:hypothetical protein